MENLKRCGFWQICKLATRWHHHHLLLSRYSHVQLCGNPVDGSPPGSLVPRIVQARTLEWVAISFSSAWKWKVKVKPLSHVRLVATPWTAAYQAPLPMGFSRQECWSGLPLPSRPVEIKLKMVLCSGLLGETLLPATLAIIKILGHSILDSLEAKGNYFVDISTKNAFLKDTNSSQTSVIVQQNVSPNNNLEKLARQKQQLASEKDKKKRLEIQLLV